jgi:HEPN domain-containing protein
VKHCDILMARMNRLEFQALAVERLSDAEALLKAGRFACAYYIAGYAVECALKACIARKTNQHDFPPREAPRFYIHDIQKLLESADLGPVLKQEVRRDAVFESNWTVVVDWTEETRYDSRGQGQAERIVTAINDPQHGVLQWLRRNW